MFSSFELISRCQYKIRTKDKTFFSIIENFLAWEKREHALGFVIDKSLWKWYASTKNEFDIISIYQKNWLALKNNFMSFLTQYTIPIAVPRKWKWRVNLSLVRVGA